MAAYRFIRAVTLLLALCALVQAQFKPGTPFGAGVNSNSIAIADFNGDGYPDLAITNPTLGSVTVLPGNGTGKFPTSGNAYTVGQHPTFLLAGDFNKDGYPDLVVANELDNTITVLLNNKMGGFLPGTAYKTGQRPVFIAALNNANGFPDLAIANGLDNTVSVLKNDQAGGFATSAPGSPFAVGGFPSSIAVGDVNVDGLLDLAVANLSTNNITVLLGNPAGSASAFMALTTGPIAVPASPLGVPAGQAAPISIALGDVNGDGYPDMAIANEATNTVTILLNNAKLGFTPSPLSPYTLPGEPVFLAMADLNWDGHPDLAIVTMNGGVTVLLGSATGTFSPAMGSPYPVGASPLGLAIGDVNGDGKPDLAVADSGDSTVTILLNGFAGLSILSPVTNTAPVSPGSLVTIWGSNNLATAAASAGVPPLPVLLGGISATITYSSGPQVYLPLYYVSPSQINAVLPPTMAPLPGTGVINVFTPTGSVSGPVSLALAAPGLFTVSGGPTGVALGQVLTLVNFQLSNLYVCSAGTCIPNPISVASDGSTEMVLYGTGIENAAAGNLTIVIGGQSITPLYYGPTGSLGVDEVVVQLPAALAGKGVTTAAVAVAGITSNAVMLSFK